MRLPFLMLVITLTQPYPSKCKIPMVDWPRTIRGFPFVANNLEWKWVISKRLKRVLCTVKMFMSFSANHIVGFFCQHYTQILWSCLFFCSDKFQKRKVSQLGILDRYDKVCAPCLHFSKISKLDLWLYVRFNGVEIDLNTKIGHSNQSTNFQKLCFLVVFATNRVAGLYYLQYLQK